MKTDKKASIAGFETLSFTKSQRKLERIDKEQKRQMQSNTEMNDLFSPGSVQNATSDEDETPSTSSGISSASKSHKRTVCTGTKALFPMI